MAVCGLCITQHGNAAMNLVDMAMHAGSISANTICRIALFCLTMAEMCGTNQIKVYIYQLAPITRSVVPMQ